MFFKKNRSSFDISINDIKPIRRFDIDPEVESERLLTLKYISNEIKRRDIQGDIAEAGVMKGYFARYLRELFPNKQLHLFDTFNGFDPSELDYDDANGFLTDVYSYDMFNNNSVNSVKQVIPSAIYHIGKFEDTISDLSDSVTFSCVSIDMDLYIPTLQALRVFYPMMLTGGYILVHDYNHPEDFKGARAAVIEFEKTVPDLKMCPLPDYSGTLVILK